MTQRRFGPDDPREWLNRARSNLALAKARIPEAYLEDLCFEAQQAAEKAVKGLLVHKHVEFPYIHDLARLLTLLEKSGETIPAPVKEASYLTSFAVVTRYPGAIGFVSEEQYRRAITIAELIVEWVEGRIKQDV